MLEKSRSTSSKLVKFLRSPINESIAPKFSEKGTLLSCNWHKEPSILNEETKSREIKFQSILNSFKDLKFLKEPGLTKEKLVSSSLKVSKELALEKFGKLPKRFIFPDRSRTVKFSDWKFLRGNLPSRFVSAS